MRIVFLKDVKGYGRRGDIREVPDGYAKNFLLPKKMAVLATEGEVKKSEANKAQTLAEETALIARSEALAESLKDFIFEFKGKANGEELFGSITAKDIERSLEAKGGEEVEIDLAHPLKKLGEHELSATLAGKVPLKVRIKIIGE